jgi:hypothetical protein
MKEGVYKMLNGAIEKINQEQLILMESWKKTKARLQEDYPTATIKYSYKTQQFTVLFPLPKDLFKLKALTHLP